MKTVMRLATIATGFALGSILGPHAAHASGDAPWCAITQVGDGDGQWDCQYETVEECVPAVQAGNRGHCNSNPWARLLKPACRCASVLAQGARGVTPPDVRA